LQGSFDLHFDLFFTALFLMVVGSGGGRLALLWKYMIDASAGNIVIAASCA